MFILITQNVWGQNLNKIGKKDAVTVSGGINFNTITYLQSVLLNPSRDPFTWFASGNLNISILDVAFPFTYSYSNQGSKFTQPFNRAALQPSYKWAKAHIGLVSMNFSPYTLNGHIFLGGGVELTPGKWNIQAMGGRLRKELEFDAVANNLNEISFRRWGYGLKVGYADKGYSGEMVIFKANDDINSLSSIPLNSNVRPQDNVVISFKGSTEIIKSLKVEAEYAISGLTEDLYDQNDLLKGSKNVLYKAINGNGSTNFYHAFNSSINYSFKSFTIGAKFEHIDGNYKTLGGYYFNNDLQNYTLTPAISLFKKKLNISVNSGFQRNNLSGLNASTTNRWIGSGNISFTPNSKLLVNASYSNFSTFSRNRPITDPFYAQPIDTLNFFQLSQNASAMITTNWGPKESKSAIQLLYNYMESTSLSGNIEGSGVFGIGVQSSNNGIPTNAHMTNLSYSVQFSKIAASLAISGNVNYSITGDQSNLFLGPSLTFGKSIKSIGGNLSVGSTFNQQFVINSLSSNVLNHRAAFNWSPKFKNEKIGSFNFGLNANLLQKFAISQGDNNVHELNIFFNLAYNFSS